MLVIISDLHLTDGSSGETVNDRAFRIFKNRLSDMAYDASWRVDDNGNEFYNPIDHVDIILLGDIMDMIRSEQWYGLDNSNMPWTMDREDDFYNIVNKIATGVLDHNATSFRILKGLKEGDLSIPAAMRYATDDEAAMHKVQYISSPEKVKLKVNIHYMIGNHDWFFYIDDARMNPIRNAVIDALGLCNDRNKPFPYFPHDNTALQATQDDHRVYALHGDEFDAENFTAPSRDGSSIGDVIVIRLLNQIPKKVLSYLGAAATDPEQKDEVTKFIQQLREIDNLRPYSLAAAWITQAIKDTKLNDELVNNAIREALRDVIRDFVNNDIVSKDLRLKIEMTATRMLLSHYFSIEMLNTIVNHFGLNKDHFESYQQYAIKMSAGMEKDFFVMGHTHYAEVVPLSSYIDEAGIKRSRIYMNTGTWRSMHKTGVVDSSFISYKVMTIAGFYKADERKGRAFEYWTASLAL